MTYIIEKNVPMPEPDVDGRGKPSVFPWSEMEVGDSVLIPRDQEKTAQKSMANWNQNHKPKRLVSKQFEDGSRRFWRQN